MTTRVSYKLAKLLIQKGYDLHPDFKDSYTTIAEVVMWLNEKYKIWIEVSLTDNSRYFYFDYTIITSNDRDWNDEDCFDSAKRIYDEDKHNSPTEAYEAAIEYCLTKLIK